MMHTTMIRRGLSAILIVPWCLAAAGTILGGGDIITRTDVKMWADLALDLRDLKTLLQDNQIFQAKQLYNVGNPTRERSLHSLSADLGGALGPNYIYQLNGLADEPTETLRDYSVRGNDFVESTMDSRHAHLASTAIVVLVEWMYATHLLYEGITKCQTKIRADIPDIVQLGGGGMDEFIALWIGQNQTLGTNEGYGLYAWTQDAESMFQSNSESTEARVNAQLLILYYEASETLALPDACTRQNTETVPKLWRVAQRMVSQMTIPLIQMLIYCLVERREVETPLYALALVPQTSQCRPSVYMRLKNELIDRDVNFDNVPEILRDLRQVLDCFGFTCQDVGEYVTGDSGMWSCQDGTPQQFPLADYAPTTSVLAQARIDLDILQLGILTSFESYEFAKLLYLYGRNSPKVDRNTGSKSSLLTSLHELATSSVRQQDKPYYFYFQEYHNDPHYADKLVVDTLNGIGKWGDEGQFGSRSARTQVVLKTCAFQILYLHALGIMASVLHNCRKNQEVHDQEWDAVAANLVGSLEGDSSNLVDGNLFWNLANKRAFQFNTVNKMGYAEVNSELANLLFAGKGELQALDCDNLERTSVRIQNLLLVPLIQSTLAFAVAIHNLDGTQLDDSLVQGEAFALSVLPLVSAKDQGAAQVIRENLVVSTNAETMHDTPQAVANAFYNSLGEEIDCEQIGELPPDIQACHDTSSSSNDSPSGFVVAITVLVVLVVVLYFVFLFKRNTQKRDQSSVAGTVESETMTILENQKPQAELM